MNITKLFIALILLCCSGCSTVSLGYNHADWILRYWMNDYTSFNTAQREQIHQQVDDYLRWHRKNALPGYIAFLQNVDAAVNQEGGLTVGDVMRLRAESGKLYRLTMEPMFQPAAHILSNLNSEQISDLADTFAKRDGKQRKLMLKGSEQDMLAARAERDVELVEKLFGSLDDAQEKKITGMSLLIPFASRAFIEQREAKHAQLIALLKNKAGEAQIAALFRQWLSAPETFSTPQQQQTITAYESAMNEMTVQIVAMMTARQKHHLTEEIASINDDFKKLNAAAEAASPK
jgi:hypothetical protein